MTDRPRLPRLPRLPCIVRVFFFAGPRSPYSSSRKMSSSLSEQSEMGCWVARLEGYQMVRMAGIRPLGIHPLSRS